MKRYGVFARNSLGVWWLVEIFAGYSSAVAKASEIGGRVKDLGNLRWASE